MSLVATCDDPSYLWSGSAVITMKKSSSRVKEGVSLPKATITKIIKEMLPPDVQVAKDAQDLFIECSAEFLNLVSCWCPTEFLHLISSESNNICKREDKWTIAPRHVVKALEELEFGEYVQEVKAAHQQHRMETLVSRSPQTGARRPRAEGGSSGGMTEEEAMAVQQRMFAEARTRLNSQCGGATASAPQYPETFE